MTDDTEAQHPNPTRAAPQSGAAGDGPTGPLTAADVERFTVDGWTVIRGAFSAQTAAACRDIMWPDTGCDPNDPSTWTEPVVRLGGYGAEPFREAANSPALLAAFDQLCGPGRWSPRDSLGTIPVRFPHSREAGDEGWHIDGSFTPEGADWPPMINLQSTGRALLMLFLFSDVTEDDAPTRIRTGSHRYAPTRLAPAGEEGIGFLELAETGLYDTATEHLPVDLATGRAGDVFLCHPFLVHAAQPHRGSTPRFMAQPPLYPGPDPYRLERPDGAYSPVERSIRDSLHAPPG